MLPSKRFKLPQQTLQGQKLFQGSLLVREIIFIYFTDIILKIREVYVAV